MAVGVVHRVLHADPTDAFEMAQAAFRWGCRDHGEISLEHKLVEMRVPPTPVVKRHFGAWVGAEVFVAIPLICAVARCPCELAQVQAGFYTRQIAHGAVVAHRRTAGVWGLAIQRKITGVLEEGPFIKIQPHVGFQPVRGID